MEDFETTITKLQQQGCSGEGCGEDNTKIVQQKPKLIDKNICEKCKENKSNINYRNMSYCRDCFLEALQHKFKANIRLRVDVKRTDKILVGLSGGPTSIAMIKMMNISKFDQGKMGKSKKMFFEPTVVHIDESCIYDLNPEEAQINIQKIKELCAQSQFDLVILNIHDVYNVQNNEGLSNIFSFSNNLSNQKDNLNLNDLDNQSKLKNLIQNLQQTGSNREDMIFYIKQQLLVDYAIKNKFEKIIYGENGQRTAAKVISQICKGKGHDLVNQSANLDTHLKQFGIQIGRPMRDFVSKDILLFNHYFDLNQYLIINEPLAQRSAKNKKFPANGNIDHLVENILDKLQATNVSTCFTVLNTADKVKRKYEHFENQQNCPICLGSRDKLISLMEVESVCDTLKQSDHQNIDWCDKNALKNTYLGSETFKQKKNFEKLVCFSCRRIVESSSNKSEFEQNLPLFIQQNINTVEQDYLNEIQDNDEKIMDYYFQKDQFEYNK